MELRWTQTRPGSLLAPAKVLPALRAAVAKEPEALNLRLTLAQALFNADFLDEILALLEPLAADGDSDPRIAFHLGRALVTLGRNEAAVAYLQRAAQAYAPGAHGEWARALQGAGRDSEALEAAAAGLKHEPSDLRCLRVFSSVLFARNEPQPVYDCCRRLWQQGVRHGQVMAARAQAAAALGLREELDAFFDTSVWYSARTLTVSPSFNEGLAQEILKPGDLRPSHPYISTRGDAQRIDNFQATEGPCTAQFHTLLKKEIEAYLVVRERFADHPVIEGRPQIMNLVSWALVMRDDGFEAWHDHAMAWLSGVYYVDIPPLPESTNTPAGCIGFRTTPVAVRRPPEEADWVLKPEAGMLLLFPAYLPHRTWPTDVKRPRISIAFNVFAG